METPLELWDKYPFGVQVTNITEGGKWRVQFTAVKIQPYTDHLLSGYDGKTRRFATLEEAQALADRAALQWSMNWGR